MASSAKIMLSLIITSVYKHRQDNAIDTGKSCSVPRGAAFILHHVIDNVVDEYLPVMDDFDERINT
jgi:hypothetical protein